MLMPKFVHVFSKNNKTQVRYLGHSAEYIAALFPEDDQLPASLGRTRKKIRSMIDEAR